jgi:hypothetical protein
MAGLLSEIREGSLKGRVRAEFRIAPILATHAFRMLVGRRKQRHPVLSGQRLPMEVEGPGKA